MRRWLFRQSIDRLEGWFVISSTILLGLVSLGLYFLVLGAVTKASARAAEDRTAANVAMISSVLARQSPQSPALQQDLAALDRAGLFSAPRQAAPLLIWTPQGRLVYASDHSLIGTASPGANAYLARAMRGEVAVDLSGLNGSGSNAGTSPYRHVIRVFMPLEGNAGQLLGVAEVHWDGQSLFDEVEELRRRFTGGLLAGLLMVWLGLYGLVRRTANEVRKEYQEHARLEREREATLRGTLLALSEAVEAKDDYTGGHVERVTDYARALAEQLGMSPEQQQQVEFAAMLHDVGKISIPDAVLLKPGPLNGEERIIMEGHAPKGASILQKVPGLEDVAGVVRHHHERWNGHGYPDQLQGEEIPLGARIIAVADAYDAMTTNRPYRAALSHSEALAELRRFQDGQFDPQVVAAFQVLAANLAQRRSGGVA